MLICHDIGVMGGFTGGLANRIKNPPKNAEIAKIVTNLIDFKEMRIYSGKIRTIIVPDSIHS